MTVTKTKIIQTKHGNLRVEKETLDIQELAYLFGFDLNQLKILTHNIADWSGQVENNILNGNKLYLLKMYSGIYGYIYFLIARYHKGNGIYEDKKVCTLENIWECIDEVHKKRLIYNLDIFSTEE